MSKLSFSLSLSLFRPLSLIFLVCIFFVWSNSVLVFAYGSIYLCTFSPQNNGATRDAFINLAEVVISHPQPLEIDLSGLIMFLLIRLSATVFFFLDTFLNKLFSHSPSSFLSNVDVKCLFTNTTLLTGNNPSCFSSKGNRLSHYDISELRQIVAGSQVSIRFSSGSRSS